MFARFRSCTFFERFVRDNTHRRFINYFVQHVCARHCRVKNPHRFTHFEATRTSAECRAGRRCSKVKNVFEKVKFKDLNPREIDLTRVC